MHAGLPPLSATKRTQHRRLREQGRTDRAELQAVLRAAFVCHLGVVIDGADGYPMVVPTVYGFDEQSLYLHGSVEAAACSRPAGLTRSALHSSAARTALRPA
jgi:hypothetical protein